MNNLGSKSQIYCEHPVHTPKIAREDSNHTEFALEQVRHRQQELAVRSQCLCTNSQNQNTDQHKRQLLRLMAMVKLQKMGYYHSTVSTFIQSQLSQLNLDKINTLRLDQLASIITDKVVLQLLGQNGVKLLVRDINSERQSVRNPNELPPTSEQEMHQNSLAQITCSICYLPSPHYCQLKCRHAFCYNCMRGYIHQSISNGNHNIRCPQYQCEQTLSLQTIEVILTAKEFKRFLYFKDKNQKEMDPNNKFCHQPDCGELLIKKQNCLLCLKCQSAYCQVCLQAQHQGRPCDVVLKHALQATFTSFKIKKCPKCQSPIQKYSGCNHMSCKKCQFEFCWVCLRRHTKHHYRYYNCCGCPGMQYQQQNSFVVGRLKQFLLYLIAPILLALLFVCFLLLLPFYMIGCFIYQPFFWIRQGTEMCEGQVVHFLCCCNKKQCKNCQILLWFFLQPRAIAYCIFMAPVKIGTIFYGQISRIFD